MFPLQSTTNNKTIELLHQLTPLQRDVIKLVAFPQFQHWPDRWSAPGARLAALARGLVTRGLLRPIADAADQYEVTELGAALGMLAFREDGELDDIFDSAIYESMMGWSANAAS